MVGFPSRPGRPAGVLEPEWSLLRPSSPAGAGVPRWGTRRRLVPAQPAAFMVFDLLSVDNVDVRPMRWTARTRLEALATGWQPPLQLSPVTAAEAEAREWLDAFRTTGVEGPVIKGATTRYSPGRRDWSKVNSVGLRCVRFLRDAGVVPGQRAA
ncbi:hypothetical protein [Kribbella sp. NPDC051620]|uniref:ATP-dependent DNA ligase n=1 Tax=Kribbella sp. NPDC051620 TaxID=3364120 RepID=UPI00379C7E67